MINFNGQILQNHQNILDAKNRGLLYGDAVFEEIRVVNNHIHFLEEHYLRLMSSMRILRMEIPMEFTMEFMESEILKTISLEKGTAAHHIKFMVYRDSEGAIHPKTNTISYLITADILVDFFFVLNEEKYEVELFKDFYKSSNLLATLNTNNSVLNVVATVFAAENDYQDCLLLNESKNVVETIYGNLFLVKGKTIKTAPLKDGCLNGVLRKVLLDLLGKLDAYEVSEESISPFELQKADELFIVHPINGIKAISKYRKKTYTNTTSKELIGKLNAKARLNNL